MTEVMLTTEATRHAKLQSKSSPPTSQQPALTDKYYLPSDEIVPHGLWHLKKYGYFN